MTTTRDQQINEAAITTKGPRFTKSLEFVRGAKWADEHPLDAPASRRFLAEDLEKAKREIKELKEKLDEMRNK